MSLGTACFHVCRARFLSGYGVDDRWSGRSCCIRSEAPPVDAKKADGARMEELKAILSWQIELNAFLKSTFTRLVGGRLFRYILLAWTAASTPPAIPKPSWWSANSWGMDSGVCRLAQFEVSLFTVQPTAILVKNIALFG